MKFHLKVWRQKDSNSEGTLEDYTADNIPADASFLEMLDIVNNSLTGKDIPPIQFESDCREGICGSCSLTINGVPHGPGRGTTCQLYMRNFRDGDTITIEPFRADAFPVRRDVVVDRSAFDRIIQAGGYISERSGSAPDANSVPISKTIADKAMDAAACIGCGACAAACPKGSAMVFVSAKVTHLGLLPQGKPEADRRVLGMVRQMDKEGFGNCSNYYACEAVCPASVPAAFIGRMNREFTAASMKEMAGMTV
jgi:succinate dehydrogenase / fumarate reductase iron-sulfur subunit